LEHQADRQPQVIYGNRDPGLFNRRLKRLPEKICANLCESADVKKQKTRGRNLAFLAKK